MRLPNVNIEIGNGLGKVNQSNDGVSAMVLTGAIEGDMMLNTAYVFTSSTDLERYKVTEANNLLLCHSVKEFYAGAGEGVTLNIMIVAETTTLTAMCEGVDSPLGKMLVGANGKIRLVSINKKPATDYAPTIESCVDGDVITAVASMQVLAENMQEKIMPFRAFIPAYGWTGETTAIYAPNESSSPNVGVVISATDKGIVAVGRVQARAAKEGVSTSIARVASGQIADIAKWADGEKYEAHGSLLEVLYGAGYIFYRQFPTRNGYYLNDDCMASPTTNDAAALNIGRVIDKAYVTCYGAYLNFVNEKVLVDIDGKILAGSVAYIENVLEDAILNAMRNDISSATATLDKNIDVLATQSIEVALDIVPIGTIKHIKVLLKMNNPNNN